MKKHFLIASLIISGAVLWGAVAASGRELRLPLSPVALGPIVTLAPEPAVPPQIAAPVLIATRPPPAPAAAPSPTPRPVVVRPRPSPIITPPAPAPQPVLSAQ